MRRLGDNLSQMLEALGLGPAARAALAVSLWPEVAGPLSAAHSRAVSFRDGVLTVAVAHSGWNQQLSLEAPRLLEAYRRRLGRGVVKEVRFLTDPKQARTRPATAEAGPSPEPEPPEEVSVEPAAHSDPELARLLTRVREEAARAQGRARRGNACPRCGAPNPEAAALCPACRVDDLSRK